MYITAALHCADIQVERKNNATIILSDGKKKNKQELTVPKFF